MCPRRHTRQAEQRVVELETRSCSEGRHWRTGMPLKDGMQWEDVADGYGESLEGWRGEI